MDLPAKPRIRVPARSNGLISEEEVGIQAIAGALEQFNRAYQQEARGLTGDIALADPFRLFPDGQFTQYNPSVLVSRKGLRIFDSMRQDDQIKAALSLKKLAVLATGWQVVSPEDQPPDWEPTRFVERQLKELEGTLDQNLLEIMTALDYGYSITEKVYQPISEGEFSGKMGLEALRTKKPHTFELIVDQYGKLLDDGIVQQQAGVTGGLGGGRVPMPRAKFVLLTYRPEFGNPYGHSDLEEVYRPWWSKNNAYKWLTIYLERFGIPPVIAMYNPNAFRGSQLERLKTLMTRLQAATSGMVPRGSKDDLEMWAPEIAGQAARVFMPAMDMYDKHMARGILMPGLLGMTPDQQQGSFARSRVSFDVFMLVVDFLRAVVAETVINEQVVRQMVDLNYPVEEYPQFRFLPISDEFRADVLEKWTDMIGAGVVSARPGDEKHIREIVEFPEAEEDDMPLEPEIEPEPEDGLPPEDGDDTGGDQPSISEPVRRQSRFAAGNKRRKTKPERVVNFQQIERDLDRMQRETVDAIVPIIEAERDRIMRATARRGIDQRLINSVRVSTQSKAAPILSDSLGDSFRQGRRDATQEIRRGAGRREMQEEPTFVPKDALEFLAAKAVTATSVIDPRLRAELQIALQQSLKMGEGVRDAMERIRKVWEPYAGDPTKIRDGRPVTPARLETIVRTNLTEAMNDGRLVAIRAPAVDDFVAGVQYSAIIDTRTTEVCRHLDERIFRKDSAELTRLAPPNHFNCRSLLVPVTIDVEVEEDDFITGAQIGRGVDLAGTGFA